jgi:NitT/TauT family transport system substrate-binding protein
MGGGGWRCGRSGGEICGFAEVARADGSGLISWLMRLMKHLRRIGCALLLATLVVGCGRNEPDGTARTKPIRRKVVLQTDWFPQAEHGGFYQALAKGFYAQAGIDLEILSGGPGAGIKLKVVRGDADFGLLKSDDIIVAASRGLPLVMVAATLQHDPQAVMVHADSPIKSLKDLKGRVVIASASMTWIPYVQKKYRITFDLKPNTYGLGEFLANKDAIQQCLVTSEPFFAQQHGKPVRTLPLAESGYDCYHVIFCRRELVRLSPDVVRAFVHASIRGWRDYLQADPAPAHAAIRRSNPQMTSELLDFSRSEMIMRSLVHGDPAKGEDIGQLSLVRLTEEMQMLLDLKILDAPVGITTVATKDFLPSAPP